MQPLINIPYMVEAVSSPENTILTLEEIKTYLRIEHSEEDELLLNLAHSVIGSCEKYLGKSLTQRQYRAKYRTKYPTFRLLYAPIQQVDMVQLWCTADLGETLVEGKDYTLSTDYTELHCQKALSDQWIMDVTYTTGVRGKAILQVPDELRQGMLMHLAVSYENREGYFKIPEASLALYYPYRRVRL